jgi:N-acetylneuraminate synthase
MKRVNLQNGRVIGKGEPVYIIAEIGINHNGSLDLAKKLIDWASIAGCDAVKFQKRTPELCVPKDQWDKERNTPWGKMSYIDYKRKTEFGKTEFEEIDRYCKQKNIDWFASAWDEPSIDFLEQFDPVMYKFASASLTDFDLIRKAMSTGRPIMLSTGMSTEMEIEDAVALTGTSNVMIAHSTSAYPCNPAELNLRMIPTLQARYDAPIGYSGHEVGLAPTLAAVSLGATFVERHVTLDRAMWGSDHAASVEPQGVVKLVRDIRDIEKSLGDGIKKVYESEFEPMKRLRKVIHQPVAAV